MARPKKAAIDWHQRWTEQTLFGLLDAVGGQYNEELFDARVERKAMLVELRRWISLPESWAEQKFDVGAAIQELLDQSVDPYQMIPRTLSAHGIEETCLDHYYLAVADQREEDYRAALLLYADQVESGNEIDFSSFGPWGLATESREALAACLRREAKKW